MTKPKAAALGSGGPDALAWWDGELVPEAWTSVGGLAARLREPLHDTGIDVQRFAASLIEPLADCRASMKAQQARGQRAAVITWLEQAAAGLDAALADGRLRRMPAFHAAPAVGLAAIKLHGCSWAALLRSGDKGAMQRCLIEGAASLRREHARDRRPKALGRDHFLAVVIEALRDSGLAPVDAEHHAGLVVAACGLPVPEASIARAARRGTGQFLSRGTRKT